MNVLLCNPCYPDTFWSFKHVLAYVSRKAAFPPLGLLTLAAMLPVDWKKQLVDLNVEALSDERIAWADMIFIGAMLVQKDSACEIIRRCKAAGKTVTAGGPLFSAMPELFPEVDHLVLNEAEITLPPFLRDLEAGRARRMYASEERPDLALTPIPLWELINFKNYVTLSVQYSRGCPFDCEFCEIVVMNGRKPRVKSPEQMLREFDALWNAGWRGSVFIVDDNFIGNKVRVKELLPQIIAWQKARRYPFSFFTEASLNLAQDAELMRLMSAANFGKVFLGIETPSTEGLNECGKHQNTQIDLTKAVELIHANGMQVMAGFIVGFDSDTEKIFDAQWRFIQRVGVVTAMVGMLTAMPGTRLWHRLKAENRLLGPVNGENTSDSLNFIPKMGAETLLEGYKRLVDSLYTPKQYYRRINTFMEAYRPTVRSRLTRQDIAAVLRSIWRIGICSRSRLLYWRLLTKTALTKFRALPAAIELAIQGVHYEKCARRLRRN